MKTLVVAVMLLLIAAFSAPAQDQAESPFGIPTPPGATLVTEMNISREQLLTQIDVLVFALMSSSDATPTIDTELLKESLGTLDRLQFAEMTMKGNYSASNLLGTLEKQVGGRRVIYDVSGNPGKGILLLATADGYLAAKIDPEESKTKTGKIRAIRLFGCLDFVGLITTFADTNVLGAILNRGR